MPRKPKVPKTQRRELTQPNRIALVSFLLHATTKNKIESKSINLAMKRWSISRSSVYSWWKKARASQENVATIIDIATKANLRGRKQKYTAEVWHAMLLSIPAHKRSSWQSLVAFFVVGKSTIAAALSRKYVVSHTSSLKPKLSDEGKTLRLAYAWSFLNHIQGNQIGTGVPFVGMYDYIHVDEKWFHLTKITMNTSCRI